MKMIPTAQSSNQQQVNATQQIESITGVVERLTYYSEESGYTVARLQRPGSRDLTTVTGNFANIQPGQTLQLTGFWREHPQYGAQFQVVNYKETKPATLTGLEKYLGSGLIKGVGPVTAKRIVNHFGLETLDIIETQIDTEEQEVIVQYAERNVTYDYADLNEIALAWSVTIHKSQGSEYPVVIMPLYTQHYMMLSRNLLYTGLTRAKKLAIIVGSKKAIGMAVRSVNQKERYTQLQQRLVKMVL
jgi:ATP-dependent exoDNAse (exonuclease V) alpha subunit